MSIQHLEFNVIHATGWDENYPPEQLVPKDRQIVNNGGVRHGKGWQSPRLCEYPQEIILQLIGGPARILKIQILSHHYKIASKLDIYVGSLQRRKEMVGMAKSNARQENKTLSWEQIPKIIDYDNDDEENALSDPMLGQDDDPRLVRMNDEPYVHFRRLGYCALDSNERAHFKARELKSVRLDTEGEYIRLVARRCHSNHLNQSNQVGLVGITVMGEPVDDLLDGESQTIPLEHTDNDVSRVASPETCVVPIIQDKDSCSRSKVPSGDHHEGMFASLYSILPSSASNVTPEKPADFLQNNEQTTALIAAFDRAKDAAVEVEDFHSAQVFKESMKLVQQGADEVCHLDALKRQAVEKEDFDSAAQLKKEIENIKTSVQTQIVDEGIQLDKNGDLIIFDGDFIGTSGSAENSPMQSLVEDGQQSLPQKPRSLSTSRQNTHDATRSENFQNVAADFAGLDLSQRQYNPVNESGLDSFADIARLHRSPSPLSLTKSRTSSGASRMNAPAFSSSAVSDQEPLTPTSPVKESAAAFDHFEDERPLPALTNSKTNSPMIPPVPVENEPNDDEPEELSDLARTAFGLSVQVFGDRTIACLMSKKFKWRESALIDVTHKVDVADGEGRNVSGSDKLTLVKAAFQVLQEGLNDNREKLTLQTLTFWGTLIGFCAHHQIPQPATSKLVEQTFPALFSKISDTNPRIKQGASDLFVMLARSYRAPNQAIVSLVLKPSHSQTQPPKQAKAKVELVTRLVEEFGIALIPKGRYEKDVGLSLEAVMEVAVSYLNNNNGEVRDSAVKLVVQVCRLTQIENIETFLADVKPMIVENIRKLAMELPPPPPVLTMLDVDEQLLQRPLAKRGTVTRLEQQLMELKAMVNNVNHFVADDYGTYVANTRKSVQTGEANHEGDNAGPSAAPTADASKSASTPKKTAASRTSKTSTPNKASAIKKTKKKDGDDAAEPRKQKPTTKPASSSSSRAVTAQPKATTSRRGSTEDEKSLLQAKSQKHSGKTTHGKLAETPPSAPQGDDDSKSDRCCIFCDESNDDFTEENLLTHYWNECPVLTKCPLCNIILEISTLDDHMLCDCDKSKFVKQCPRCREVIPADNYLEHVANQTCMVIPSHIVRCPLCKSVVKPATELGWKAHLLDADGCSKNRRKERPLAATTPSKRAKELPSASGDKRTHRASADTPKTPSSVSKATGRKLVGSSKDKTRKVATKPKIRGN